MKKIALLLATCLLALTACQSQQTNHFLISDNGIGAFSKNLTVADLMQKIPAEQLKKVKQTGEFQDDIYTVYQYTSKDNEHLLDFVPVVDTANAKITQIEVVSPQFKTAAGWGVGSAFSEVIKHTQIFQASTDMEVIHIQIATPKLWLIIDKQDLKDGWWNEQTKRINIDKIPADAKVKHIIQYVRHSKMM